MTLIYWGDVLTAFVIEEEEGSDWGDVLTAFVIEEEEGSERRKSKVEVNYSVSVTIVCLLC